MSDLSQVPGLGGYLAAQNQSQQQTVGNINVANLIEQLQQRAAANQREQGYRQELTALGPNPTQEQLTGVAAKYGSPDTLVKIQQQSIDKQNALRSQRETADARLAQQMQYAQMMHEFRMANAKTEADRAAETARHDAQVEELTKQSNEIRKQVADFNAPPGAAEGGTVENVAHMIGEGRIQPLSGFALRSPWGQAVMSKVMDLYPDYQGQDFAVKQTALKNFTSGKQGNQVRSFNVGLAHLDTLGNLADALNNGDTQLINKASNAVATAVGKPNVNNFEAAKQIVGDEIVKAIVGAGGGVSDREKAQQTVAAANSPAQLRGVINTYKELMKGQLNGLQLQYETSTGRNDFSRFLSPEALAVSHAQQGQGGQIPKISNDAEYNALPSGATYIAPDGSTRKKK